MRLNAESAECPSREILFRELFQGEYWQCGARLRADVLNPCIPELPTNRDLIKGFADLRQSSHIRSRSLNPFKTLETRYLSGSNQRFIIQVGENFVKELRRDRENGGS